MKNKNIIILILLTFVFVSAYVPITNISIADFTTGEKARVNNGAIDINASDQYSRDVSLFMTQQLSVCVLDVQTATNDVVVKVTTSGTVPVAGNMLELYEGDKWNQTEIKSVALVAGNQYNLTLHVPIDLIFTTSATCNLTNADMDVNGSLATPIKFCISPQFLHDTIEWHINRMMVVMIMTTAGDGGLFGNLTALTNGQYFRLEDGTFFNDMHITDNSDFRLYGYDLTYTTRSGGGGSFGLGARITFNGKDKRGVAKRLTALGDDLYCSYVVDNLTTLVKYRIMLQGHLVD